MRKSPFGNDYKNNPAGGRGWGGGEGKKKKNSSQETSKDAKICGWNQSEEWIVSKISPHKILTKKGEKPSSESWQKLS